MSLAGLEGGVRRGGLWDLWASMQGGGWAAAASSRGRFLESGAEGES